MKSTISHSVEETTEPKGTKSRSKRSLKAVAAVAATAIAVGSVGLTAANWTDSETVGSELSSGHFDMEISVDDGATWHTQTVENGALDLSMSSVFADSAPWGPNETRESKVLLRLSEDTTHDGFFQLDDMVSVEGSGNVDDYSWSIADITLNEGKGCGTYNHFTYSDIHQVVLFEGDSLDEAEPYETDRPYYHPPERRPISHDLYSLPMFTSVGQAGHLTRSVFDVKEMALCFEVSSSEDLAENGGASAEWTLNVEQSNSTDIARDYVMTGLMNDPEGIIREMELDSTWEYFYIPYIYSFIQDVEETRSVFEEAGLIEYLSDDIEWTIDGMIDIRNAYLEYEISDDPEAEAMFPDGINAGEFLLFEYNYLNSLDEEERREISGHFGEVTIEEFYRLTMGDELFDRILERYDITLPSE